MSNRTTLRIVAVLAVVAIVALYLRSGRSALQRAKNEAHAQTHLPAQPRPGSERPLDRDFKAAMQRESAVVSRGSVP